MWKLNNLKPFLKSHKKAILYGLHRDFNKASTENWGTNQNPVPTLGLKRGNKCVGIAYEFDDKYRDVVLDRLTEREGSDFMIKKKIIEIDRIGKVNVYYPYNRRNTFRFWEEKV